MLRHTLQWLFVALVFNIIFNPSCTKDIVTEFPGARFIQAENTLFQDTTLCLEQSFEVLVRMEAGLSKMLIFEIYEDEKLLPSDRFFIRKPDNISSANPRNLEGREQGELEYTINVEAPIFHPDSMVTDTVINYFFRTIDELNQPAVASLAIQYRLPQLNITTAQELTVIEEDTLVNLFLGEELSFQVELSDCWKDLEALSITEDGVLIPDSRLIINRIEEDTIITPITSSNPIAINDDVGGQVIYDIQIAQNTIAPADQSRTVYAFALSNVREQIGRDTFIVLNVEGKSLVLSTPDTATLTNQADELLRGGLDLDTGEQVDIADTLMAEIEDEGIITATSKWRQQISVVNPEDSEMRQVRGFTAADFTIVQQLERAFNQGEPLNGNDSSVFPEVSDPVTGENVSAPIEQGDTFIILRQGIYYFIECVQIKDNTDNSDSYEFAILY
ncbi:MAG: hypothetical protein AAF849_04725 [Bacteroidota bacterium]